MRKLSQARQMRTCLREFRVLRKTQRGKLLSVATVAAALVLSGCGFMNWIDHGSAIAQTSGLSYPIVDTGQVKTYDNSREIAAPSEGSSIYGQDAQIDGNQPSYVVNGDGTVTDQVTGLMWTQGYYGKMTYSEALTFADGINLAGYSDWRLPSIKELYSLMDFRGEDLMSDSTSGAIPFIDTDFFDFEYGDTSAGERSIDSQWATTTTYVGSEIGTQMFGVNFADGRIKGYGTGAMGPQGEKTFFVRLVRGNTAYGENDFINNGDGTITDLATGLMWSQDDSGSGMDWEDALSYVQDLNDQNYLGYSDWYLPNAKELQSIVDYTRSPSTTNSAAIDPMFNATSFINEDGERDWGFYWTSTTHASPRGGQAAAYIAFGRGLGYMNNQYVDIHGAGCQRSDPKTGSAIPTGRGPQGDTVRVNNMVRVVRDVTGTAGSLSDASSPDSSSGSDSSSNSNLAVGSSETGEAGDNDQQFVLFAPLGGKEAYLIDRQGDLVHSWALAGRPGNSVYLMEGGDLLATYTVRGTLQGGGIGGGAEYLTWDGDEVWSFELANDNAHLHHDVEMLPNGNVLMISWEVISRSEALAAGLSASQLPESGEVWSEMILEYDPDQDRVVWEWHLWNHVLPEGWDASEHPEKIDLDAFANPKSEDWWHFNAVDYSEEHDHIIISSRAASEFWIIDHDLTTTEAEGNAGDLLFRFGNPAMYGGAGEQILVDQHDSEWIDDHTILVFDNGNPRTRPYSRVVEIDLPDYTSSPTGVMPDAEIVWQYPSEPGNLGSAWFADHISGSQRLSSGNTLICSGTEGRFFEVTPDNETVWEYTNPFASAGPNGQQTNEVFRCDAYSAAFIGQSLGDAAEYATSSSSPQAPQNVVSDEQPSPGTGAPANQAPGGIIMVDPITLIAGSSGQLVTIELDPQFSPPAFVEFTRVAISDITATSWSRSGDTLTAWFDIPSQLPAGECTLTATFPGRNQEPITFSFQVEVR